jgi:hypothetical protein
MFMPSTICFVLSNHFCAYKLTALESFIIRCIGDFYLFIYLFIYILKVAAGQSNDDGLHAQQQSRAKIHK